MKRLLITLIIIAATLTGFTQVAVNTDGSSADASAMLDIKSDTAGILIPRMTATQRDAISNPAQGLMVFVTTDSSFYYYKGDSWSPVGSKYNNTLDEAYDQDGFGAGKNITADAGALRVNGTDGFLVTGTFGSGNTIDTEITGTGTRMFFNPKKAAFRAGYVNGTQWDDNNIGDYSVGMGYNVKAIGNYSTALGINAYATGIVSVAIGESLTASGYNSTAIGSNTRASGDISTTMGRNTKAFSYAEIAIGSFNTDYTPAHTDSWDASDRLFVIGNGVDVNNKHNALTIYKDGRMNINDEYFMPQTDGAAGQIMQTDGAGQVSFVDASTIGNTLDQAYDQGGAGAGKNITADAGAVRVDGTDGFLVTGTIGSGNYIDAEVTGGGPRMFFNPRKAAFRAGFAYNDNWDNINIGEYSVAMGYITTASGFSSTAMGYNSTASGRASTAIGRYTTARSLSEIVVGSFNTDYTPASSTSWDDSDRLFVIGNGQDANNKSDALIVYKNGKSSFYDMVRVHGTDGLLVTGVHGMGNTIDTEITGYGTRMFFNPYKSVFRAGFVDAHQWDDANIGEYSVALGHNTTASGGHSTAMGYNTTASGAYSVAIGRSTTASGDNSTAMGKVTTAPSYMETTLGSYNTNYTPNSSTNWNASDRLFVIGNGQSSSNKSDALIVYKNGNTELHKKLTAPTSGTDADLKPYIYGSLKDTDGSFYPAESTSGFTSTKESTGVYKITFDSYSSDKSYLVIANALRTSGPVILTYEKNFGYFRIRAWNLSGALIDTYLNFVVYKK